MKASSIFAASLLVAGAAFAGTTEVTNDLVIGVMPIPLAAGQKEAILSIPWIEAGTNTAATAGVAVTNLIKTATLTAGDELRWYDPEETKYGGFWTVGADGQWQAASLPGSDSVDSTKSDSTKIKRGHAVILTRKSNFSNATNVYVVGQYTSNPAGTMTIAKATESEGKVIPTYTLIAPPDVSSGSSVNLNSYTWSNVGRSDTLITGLGAKGPIEFIRGKVKVSSEDVYYWGTNKYEKVQYATGKYYTLQSFDPNALIPIGKGFWYKSTETSKNASVTWATVGE